MTTLWHDIKYGLRMLAKSPGFAVTVIVILALGIGANTAIFSLIDALLLKSLPGVKNPQQLVLITVNGWTNLSYPLYEHLRDNSQSFSGLFASTGIKKRMMRVVGSGAVEGEPVWNQAVSGNFFSVLGTRAIFGRILTPDDDLSGVPQPVAVISYDFWDRRFGRNPAVLGQTVTLGGVPLTIVGVTARAFGGFVVGVRPDLWWPIQMFPQVQAEDNDRLTQGGSQWLQIAGRLQPDVAETQAQNEVGVVFRQMLLTEPGKWQVSETDRQKALTRIELQPAGMGFTRLHRAFDRMLFVLMATAGLLLIVACTNLAGLLLARGAARQHEFRIRVALGAGRPALLRQLITESLLLALVGGIMGLLLAQWGVRLLVHYISEHGDVIQLQLTPDLRILAFTFLVSVGTGLLFGLLPSWRCSRLDVGTAPKERTGNLMGRVSGPPLNKALLVAQIALSCCLLIGAGLFTRTFQKLRAVDVGFNRENLMVFELTLGHGYDDSLRRGSLYEDVVRRVRNLLSVRSASMSSIESLGGSETWAFLNRVAVVGNDTTGDEGLDVRGTAVGPDYFQTMRIPLLMGRDFGPQDELLAQTGPRDQVPYPVIIDESIERKLFGSENPVGRLLRIPGRSSAPHLEVIGVARDVIHKELRKGPRTSIYILVPFRSGAMEFFHVRTSGPPQAVAGAIRQVVHKIDPQVEVTELHTIKDLVDDQLRRERMLSQISGFFSLTALALVCLGLYGILSYSVARRTREIGIRMALGAQKRNVLSGVIRQGMMLALIGCGLGVVLAITLTRIVSSLLYDVTTTDPLTFILTIVLLGVVTLVSCWLPARRAAKTDPMEALRYE